MMPQFKPLNDPLISVVTPVYNGEPYLAECIESILAQTEPNWAYTIVNNCSTDRSLSIALSYAAKDPRISVVDNETFLDQVANLNRAFSLIAPESKYAKMVLADDWLFPRCFEEMVAVAEQFATAGIISSYRLDDRRVSCAGLPHLSSCYSGRDICRLSLLEDLFVFGSPSTVLFRSDIVRSRVPFYDATRLHEDTEACYEILGEWDLGFVHQVLSFTRRQNECLTATRKLFDPQYCLDKLIVVATFGPRYLDECQYAACLGRKISNYYRFLGQRCLEPVSPEFWKYHSQGLLLAGLPFKRSLFLSHYFRAWIGVLAHPRRLVRWILRLVGRRTRGSRSTPEDVHASNLA
jgi:glycosyltransferase involved in cell wall biosynthesis